MNNNYIRLYEVPVDEGDIKGSILGFQSGSDTDLSKSSVQYVLYNCVGKPDSIIYGKREFDKAFKLAKETLEKDFKVVTGDDWILSLT